MRATSIGKNNKRLTANGEKRNTSHLYEKTIQNLLEKIDVLENGLRAHGGERIKFVACFKQLEDEISQLKNKLQQNANEINALTIKNNQYQSQIETITSQNKGMLDTYKTKYDLLTRELEQKTNEISKLINNIKEKDEKIKIISINNSISTRYSDNYSEELEKEKLICSNQLKRINELHKEINSLKQMQKNESHLIKENEHLKEDTLRLLEMLKSTEEYHDFGYLDSTIPGGIRYINEVYNKNKSHHECNHIKQAKRIDKCNQNWIPSQAFAVVNEYKQKFNLDIDDNLINDMLSSLNLLWRQKEEKVISRLQAKYHREIIDLKRKYGINSSTIGTIDIRNKGKEKGKDCGKEVVDNVKKVVNDYNTEKKELEGKIDTLQFQLNDKVYLNEKKEGKTDIINLNTIITDKACDEMAKMEGEFNELYKEYKARVKDTENMVNKNNDPVFNVKMVNNTVTWLVKAMNDVVDKTKKKFEGWKNEFNQTKKV